MSQKRFSHRAAKGFAFNFFTSGNRTEYLLAIGLGVLIIGALGLTLYSIFGGGSKTTKPPDEIVYKCDSCGKTFIKKVAELRDKLQVSDEFAITKLDCPLCGKKLSAWQCVKCPKCGTPYVQETLKTRYEAAKKGRMLDPRLEIHDVCPNPSCKQDLVQWYRDHPPE
jgi:predicted RNA-binding Zn-ribbon protein involved in translation (DUF1610 family)